MKNSDVVKEFFNFMPAKGSNLESLGRKLISYNTTIAQFDEGCLYINNTYYSMSSSRHVNYAKREAERRPHLIIKYVDNVPRNSANLMRYYHE